MEKSLVIDSDTRGLNELIVDSKFKKLMVIYSNYLRYNYDFMISTGTLIDFFKMQDNLDIFNEKEFRLTLKTMLCKNKDQYDMYDELHTNFFSGKVKFDEVVLDANAKEEARIQAELFMNEKYESIRDGGLDSGSNYSKAYLDNKEYVDGKIEKLNISVEAMEAIKRLLGVNPDEIDSIFSLKDDKYNELLRKGIEDGLNELMIEVLLDNDLANISDLILNLADKLNQMYNDIEKRVAEYNEEMERVTKEIEKLISLNNRVEFIEGHNAVKSHIDILNKNISSLTTEDYVMLSNYIRANASKFKSRISRNMKKDKSRIFDYRATIKKSVKTDGVPLELIYKKPKVSKVKIVCILDISGSCIKPAKTMLNFIYELSSVFRGGVRSFVFVRDIAEVSGLFKTNHILAAIEKSMVAVTNKGSYSDYNYAFKKFDKEYISCIDKHTIVLYLGDARNNKNPSGEGFVERIAGRAKSLIWLNTEPRKKWNTGDSIMRIYEKYMDQVYEVGTVEDIINFLNTFSL